MKHKYFIAGLWMLLCVSPQPGQTQQSDAVAPPVVVKQPAVTVKARRVMFTQPIPTPVRSRMPRGAKSCFFGYLQEAKGSSRLAIHLYNKHAAKELTYDANGSYHFTVDLFEVTPVPKKKIKRYQFIQTSPLNFQGQQGPFRKFALEFLWLDPKKKTMPMLVFDCQLAESRGMKAGNLVVATFPEGWKNKQLATAFWYDEGIGNGIAYISSAGYGSKVDANGFVQFWGSTYDSSTGMSFSKTYNWNGQTFEPSEEESSHGTPMIP